MATVTLMDAARMARTLSRMAHEILERHPDPLKLAFVGVRSRGVPLARRLARLVREANGVEPAVGALDISLYRDDFTSLAAQPITKGTDILFSIDGRTVVLVDDVLYTGRTVRAALDQLIDFGRPARIELAVLVDRGHRELPIRADYAGRTLATSREEVVQVLVKEQDGRDEVQLLRRQRGPVRESSESRTGRGAGSGGTSRGRDTGTGGRDTGTGGREAGTGGREAGTGGARGTGAKRPTRTTRSRSARARRGEQ